MRSAVLQKGQILSIRRPGKITDHATEPVAVDCVPLFRIQIQYLNTLVIYDRQQVLGGMKPKLVAAQPAPEGRRPIHQIHDVKIPYILQDLRCQLPAGLLLAIQWIPRHHVEQPNVLGGIRQVTTIT